MIMESNLKLISLVILLKMNSMPYIIMDIIKEEKIEIA